MVHTDLNSLADQTLKRSQLVSGVAGGVNSLSIDLAIAFTGGAGWINCRYINY